jgi:hypothetical protein
MCCISQIVQKHMCWESDLLLNIWDLFCFTDLLRALSSHIHSIAASHCFSKSSAYSDLSHYWLWRALEANIFRKFYTILNAFEIYFSIICSIDSNFKEYFSILCQSDDFLKHITYEYSLRDSALSFSVYRIFLT